MPMWSGPLSEYYFRAGLPEPQQLGRPAPQAHLPPAAASEPETMAAPPPCTSLPPRSPPNPRWLNLQHLQTPCPGGRRAVIHFGWGSPTSHGFLDHHYPLFWLIQSQISQDLEIGSLFPYSGQKL